jgi:hypothetical protein
MTHTDVSPTFKIGERRDTIELDDSGEILKLVVRLFDQKVEIKALNRKFSMYIAEIGGIVSVIRLCGLVLTYLVSDVLFRTAILSKLFMIKKRSDKDKDDQPDLHQ